MNADGRYDGRLVPGLFLLTLSDGNNGAPEYALVKITVGDMVSVHFIGHAATPASEPKTIPAVEPTDIPTVSPTDVPTVTPTDVPTFEPTVTPTATPTDVPTIIPTPTPTPEPTVIPTATPTTVPTPILTIISAKYGATITTQATEEVPAVTHQEYIYIITPAVVGVSEVDSDWVTIVPEGAIVKSTKTAVDSPAYNEYIYIITPAVSAVEEVDSSWVTTVPDGATVKDTRTITDVAAYDEQVLVTAAYNTYVYHPEVNHTASHDGWTYKNANSHEWIKKNGLFLDADLYSIGYTTHGFYVATDGTNNLLNHIWKEVIIVDTVAWTETVNHPAVYKIVHHDAVTHQEYIYVITPASSAVSEVDSDWVTTVPDGATIKDTKTIPAVTHDEYIYVITPAVIAVDEVDSDWVAVVPDGATIKDTKTVVDTPEIPAVPGTTVDHYIDVTSTLQSLVVNGELHISADYSNQHYNALFGDPIYGYVKELKIDYTLNGVAGSKTVDEKTDMNIP